MPHKCDLRKHKFRNVARGEKIDVKKVRGREKKTFTEIMK